MEYKAFRSNIFKLSRQPLFNSFVLMNRNFEIFFTANGIRKGSLCTQTFRKKQTK